MTDIRKVKMTKKQLQDWDDTRAALMYYAPEFTHIFYTLMNADDNYIAVATDSDEVVPTAATDGETIVINVNRYFDHGLLERLFILGHEIVHNIFDHCGLLYRCRRNGKVICSDGSVLPYDENLLQWALDYVVNAILIDAKLGRPPDKLLYDTNIATHLDSVLDVYAKLFHKLGGGGGGNSPGDDPDAEGSAPGGFDTHMDPGSMKDKHPVQAMTERNQEQWNTVIQAAMEIAEQKGKLPAGLKRLFEGIIKTETNWNDHVKSFFNRRVGSGNYNWRLPDRKLIVRDIWAPRRSGFGAELVVVGGDTSGSIWSQPKLLDMWFGAITEILEQINPKQLIAVWCDQKIGRVDELEDASDLAKAWKSVLPGGGSTSFVPVFDYIRQQRLEPDTLVYLTDGFGTFPKAAPGYPVLWGALAETLPPSKYPFGEVVVLPPVKA